MKGRLPLAVLLAGLLLGRQAAAAESEPAAPRSQDSLAVQATDERALIGRKIDLSGVQLWQPGALPGQRPPKLLQQLRARPQAHFLIVHLWATWCPECKTEFRALLDAFQAPLSSKVELVPVCTNGVSEEMQKFFAQALGGQSYGRQYVSDGGPELLRSLGMEGERLPLTLLVERRERDFVVRQAFLGSIEKRRNELLDSLDQLLEPSELLTHLIQQCAAPPCVSPASLLHKHVDLDEVQEWNHETRKWQRVREQALSPGSTPWLLYLCSTTERSHRDCADDWFRLRQMLRAWLKVRGGVPVRFALVILDPRPQHAADVLTRYTDEGFLPTGKILLSSKPELLALWKRYQVPLALLLDQSLRVRLAHAGAFRLQVRTFDEAIDRLHALR